MHSNFDVIIVGAGMAGAALACALSSGIYPQLAGLRIALLEARRLPVDIPPLQGGIDSFDPRVSAITQASCDYFSRLGVWPEIQALRSCKFQRMQVWDARGTAAIGFDAKEISANQLGYIVENRVVTAALHRVLRQRSQVTIVDGNAMARLCPAGSGGKALVAANKNRQEGAIELVNGDVLKAPLIVAADGAASPCREAMAIPVRQWDYGQDAIVCTVEMARSHEYTAWQNFTADGPLAFLPLAAAGADEESSRYCSIVWSQRRQRAAELMALPEESFKQELAQALEHRLGDVLDISQRFCFALQQQHAQEYVSDGFALIADAAHTIHPLAGQGINLGFADVQCLAQVLEESLVNGRALGDLAALKRYQRERKTDNLAMMAVVEGFKRLYAQVPLPLVWLRNWGMRSVDRQAWLKNRILKYAMGSS